MGFFVLFQLKNVKFNNFNERLSGPQPDNWRILRTPETEQVPSEFQTVLEYPVEFTMVNGEIRRMEVSKEEPEWSLNFKKALLSLVKIQTPTGSIDRVNNHVRGQEGLPEFWKVHEEGVDGKCENTYQFTELPEYMLGEMTWGKIESERCEGKKVYQITKSRDVTKCSRRTSFSLEQPGKYNCDEGNCENMWQRSSMTRYIGCGSTPENMEIEIIMNEGEIQQNIMAFNTENVVTGTQQVLKVVEVRNSLSSLPEVSSPKTIDNLYFEYPNLMHLRDGQYPRSHPKNVYQQQQQQQLQGQQQKYDVKIQDTILSKLSPSTLKAKIVERISEIVMDLKEVEQFEKKHVSSQVLSISKVVSILNKEELKSLYEEIKESRMEEEEKETARQLLLEVVGITGTNECIMFMKEMIESEEFSPLRIGSVLATLPHYIRTPTTKILNEIFELIKSPVVSRHEVLKKNAQLAFATLVNRACIDSEKELRFPEWVYGEFCNSETSEVTTKFIPYFVNELRSAESIRERETLILTLGSLGHESVIPILVPIIEGRSDRSSPVEQRMAIYSLSTVTKKYRNVLLPVYSALANNPSEDRNVRIAALSMMLYMSPSVAEFQKLAISTWYEQDTEFHKFVFSTLKTLNEIRITDLPEFGGLYELVKKANLVYPLAKPVSGIISSTLNAFTAEWLKELQVGYKIHGAYSFSGETKSVYGRLEYVMQQLEFAPIEFCLGVKGTEQLVEKVSEILGFNDENPLEKIHPEWRQIIKSIDLQSKESEAFNAGAWVRLFDDVQFTSGIDASVLEPWMRTIKRSVSRPQELKKMICGKTSINFVKVNNWAPTEVVIPSDMGFPILIEYNMPAVISVRGDIDIDCSATHPKINLEVSKKVSANSMGYAGVICPITKQVIAVGINQHYAVNYPTNIAVELQGEKVKVIYTPNKSVGDVNQEIDVLAYSVMPFATIKPLVYVDGKSLVASENTKVIKSRDESMQTKEFHYGQTLGLDMKFEINADTKTIDMKNAMDKMSLYKFNPLNMGLFSFTNTAVRGDGKPSCRFMEIKMAYNPKESTTHKVEIEFGYTLAQINRGESVKAIYFQQQNQQQQQQQWRHPLKSLIKLEKRALQSTNQQHQKLQQQVNKLALDEGYGLTASVDVVLEGSNRKTYSWSLAACHGFSGVEQKWNLELEDKERMNICVEGAMQLPLVPLRDSKSLKYENMRFSYKNTIGFGKTCQEHRIKVTGTTSVSESLKEHTSKSLSSRKCEEVTREVTRLREELRTVDEESSEYREIEQELVRAVEKKNEFCGRQTKELSTLDEVNFRIEYTPMPQYVRQYVRLLDTAVKGGLLPFMTNVESGNNKNEVEVELKFRPHMNTVDMTLVTEDETVEYNNIRLPEQLENIIPMTASERSAEELLSVILGEPVYEKCTIGNDVVETYSKKAYKHQLDDCYTVLTSDCGKQHKHAVLGKLVGGKKHLMVFVENSKVTMEPTTSYTESRKEYEVEIDGKRISLKPSEKKEVMSRDGKVSYRIYR